jgi:hypothetical protein
MNDGDDEFGGNPFRSQDIFFDSSGPLDQQQQQPSFQQNDPFQPNDPFQTQQQHQPHQQQPPPPPPQQPIMNMNMNPNFPPASGPMDNMNRPQQQYQPQPPLPQQQPAGLMYPQQQQPPQQPRSWWGSLLLCLNLDTYKMYFDIDADDIVSRIRAVLLHFYKPEHFRNNVLGVIKTNELKGPDLYGPFWITMTMIFFLGVSACICVFILCVCVCIYIFIFGSLPN